MRSDLRRSVRSNPLVLVVLALWAGGCHQSVDIDADASDSGVVAADSGTTGAADAEPDASSPTDAGFDATAGGDGGYDPDAAARDAATSDAAVPDAGDGLPTCSGCCAPDNGTGTFDFPPPCAFRLSGDPVTILDAAWLPGGLEVSFSVHSFTNVEVTYEADDGSERLLRFDALITGFLMGTDDAEEYSEPFLIEGSGSMQIRPYFDVSTGQPFYGVVFSAGGTWVGTSEVTRLDLEISSQFVGFTYQEPAAGGNFLVRGYAQIRLDYDVNTDSAGIFGSTESTGWTYPDELLWEAF